MPYWDVDTGMASLLMLLTAVDEGLGSLFFGVPPEHHDAVQRGVRASRRAAPSSGRVHGVCRSADRKSPSLRRHRRSGREVAHWGRFGVAGEDA